MLGAWDEPLVRGGVFVAMFAARAPGGVLLYQWGRTRGGAPRAAGLPGGAGTSNHHQWEALGGCLLIFEVIFSAMAALCSWH